MKTLKFRDYLVRLVLSGEKNSTWRLFDDKDLQVGDEIALQVWVTNEIFGHAVITKVVEKPFRELTAGDKAGHEEFENIEEMYATYSKYYKQPVTGDTVVKILWFEIKK